MYARPVADDVDATCIVVVATVRGADEDLTVSIARANCKEPCVKDGIADPQGLLTL